MRISLAELKSIVASDEKQRFSLVHKSLPAESPSPSSQADPTETPSDFLIRANQGHSLEVSDAALHTPITLDKANLPGIVVHGTLRDRWKKIAESGGLKPMTRRHVHFATGVPKELARAFQPGDDSPQVSTDNDHGAEPSQSQAPSPAIASAAATGKNVVALPEKKDAPLVLSGMRNTSTLMMFLDLKKALGGGLEFWLSENGVVLCAGNSSGVVPLEFFEKVVEKDGKILWRNGKPV